jgi:hypothetical protein
MRRVVIESPYSGDVERNMRYAKLCVKDCISRGEAPIASHLLLTQVLDDTNPEERRIGMAAGHAWIMMANALVVYTDLGVTPGMQAGIDHALRYHTRIEHRSIKPALDALDESNVGRCFK